MPPRFKCFIPKWHSPIHILDQEITSNRARFPKYTPTYDVLEYFGSNILTTEHEQWKHQRKLTSPTFSEVRYIVEIREVKV